MRATSDIGPEEEYKICKLIEDPILLESFNKLVIEDKVLDEDEFWNSKNMVSETVKKQKERDQVMGVQNKPIRIISKYDL